MRKNNPHIRVHFEVESYKPTDILLPIDLLEHGSIPCHSIVLNTPNTQVSIFSDYLRIFVKFNNPKINYID